MLKNFVSYYENALKAVENETTTWNKVRETTSDLWYRLTQQKFLDPSTQDEKEIKSELEKLYNEIQNQFQVSLQTSSV